MKKVRRLRGIAALSAATLATLAVATPVAADDVICDCVPDRSTGIVNAIIKLGDKAFPGTTSVVFQKVSLASYSKLEDKAFPGATEFIFQKADIGLSD